MTKPSQTFWTPTAIAEGNPRCDEPGTAKRRRWRGPRGCDAGERARNGVAAAGVAGRGLIVAIVHVVAGRVAEVLVVAARVLVQDEAVHDGGDRDAGGEARDDEREPPEVERAVDANVVHGLAEQARAPARRAEPEDAVVGAADRAHEDERQRAELVARPETAAATRPTLARAFYLIGGWSPN